MAWPRLSLAFLAAVFRPATSPALGKLPHVLLPPTAFIPRALPNATFRLILAAEIPHHHACPILHVFRVMTNSKLFDQRRYVIVIGLKELLHLITFLLWT